MTDDFRDPSLADRTIVLDFFNPLLDAGMAIFVLTRVKTNNQLGFYFIETDSAGESLSLQRHASHPNLVRVD